MLQNELDNLALLNQSSVKEHKLKALFQGQTTGMKTVQYEAVRSDREKEGKESKGWKWEESTLCNTVKSELPHSVSFYYILYSRQLNRLGEKKKRRKHYDHKKRSRFEKKRNKGIKRAWSKKTQSVNTTKYRCHASNCSICHLHSRHTVPQVPPPAQK